MKEKNKIRHYDFGNVTTGNKRKISIEIFNDTSVQQTYFIEHKNKKYTLDNDFDVQPKKIENIKPGASFCLHAFFQPTIPNKHCTEHYIIRHLYGEEQQMLFRGISQGANCTLSIKSCVFVICGSIEKKIKILELTNHSSDPTLFKFETDLSPYPFSVEPAAGKVPPNSNLQITLSFCPKDQRPYFKRIFCLIKYQEPLFIDAMGIWCNTEPTSNISTLFKCPDPSPQYKNNYDSYFSDSTSVLSMEHKPLLSLSQYNIYMEHIFPVESPVLFRFSATNTNKTDLFLSWNSDEMNVFSIFPKYVKIGAGCSVQLQAAFQPHSRDMLYSVDIDGTIQWGNHDRHVALFPLTVRLLGHSFKKSCGWPAQYKVEPKCVVLPPCLPPMPVYNTFVIYHYGHLPLAFKFLPPQDTNFTVKPEQGIIYEYCQIVVVQFLPKRKSEDVYTEKWCLQFNTGTENCKCSVEFFGSVEAPVLVINDGNTVQFPPSYAGCEQSLQVYIHNPTRNTIKYNLEVLPKETVLEIEKSGEVWPYGYTQNLWKFKPVGIGYLHCSVKCTIVEPNHVMNKSSLINVEAEAVNVCLIAEPKTLNFQIVVRGSTCERWFKVYNHGRCNVHFRIECVPNGTNASNEADVVTEPDIFNVDTGNFGEVVLRITPKCVGPLQLDIMCYLIVSAATHQLASQQLPIQLAKIYMKVEFPVLQVADLLLLNAGPNFSKLCFWKMLQIKKIV